MLVLYKLLMLGYSVKRDSLPDSVCWLLHYDMFKTLQGNTFWAGGYVQTQGLQAYQRAFNDWVRVQSTCSRRHAQRS